MKATYIISKCLGILEAEANIREDGNACALLSRIQRDIDTLQPHYHDVLAVDEQPSTEESSGAQVESDNINANNPEKESTGASKPGKVSKANA